MGQVSFADHVVERRLTEPDDVEEQEPYSVYEYQEGPENRSWAGALPKKQGLYDPELEKDACGVGFAAHIKGVASHKIVTDGECSINQFT
jgi:glutamate synthase (NADH)